MEWSLFIKLVLVSFLVYYLIIIAYDLLFSGKSFSTPSQNVYDVKSLIDDDEAVNIAELDQEDTSASMPQFPSDDSEVMEDYDTGSDRSVNSLHDAGNQPQESYKVNITNIHGQGYSMQEYMKIAREKAIKKATAIAFD